MREEIEIPKAIADLREMFDVENGLEQGTTESEGKFMISKRQWHRGQVLNKLSTYFETKQIKGGYVSVSAFTFVHTTVEVKSGEPQKKKNEIMVQFELFDWMNKAEIVMTTGMITKGIVIDSNLLLKGKVITPFADNPTHEYKVIGLNPVNNIINIEPHCRLAKRKFRRDFNKLKKNRP
jgi:hypothetical protein